jgi:plastocyanin
MRLALLAFALAGAAAFAAGEPEFSLTLENHRFAPARLEVPAGKKVKLLVENKDATPAEFESETLKVEKVIAGKSRATVYVGPLKPGEYKYFDEYNEKTAAGVLVAK